MAVKSFSFLSRPLTHPLAQICLLPTTDLVLEQTDLGWLEFDFVMDMREHATSPLPKLFLMGILRCLIQYPKNSEKEKESFV